ncbi:MAG: FKBP-type peptidyl-prolyl cis-trans isomerase [Legionellales bacterium]|jgi:FKBP-type peptidyl-prolyl cis-trans isomerase FklB|nr:FKBP-type peptidyl-prolyl cis-trans isomerase [Legionellales bacterium]
MKGFNMRKSLFLMGVVFCLSQFGWADESSQDSKGVSMTDNVTANETGANFLASIGKEEGAVTTDTGLVYKVLNAGSGGSPTATSTVTVNYEGRLINGKVFDSSYQRGTPASFGVSDVIAGWTQALQLMQAGSTWELYIPANLAYGERGVPDVIPSNSVLIFKVELISFN